MWDDNYDDGGGGGDGCGCGDSDGGKKEFLPSGMRVSHFSHEFVCWRVKRRRLARVLCVFKEAFDRAQLKLPQYSH